MNSLLRRLLPSLGQKESQSRFELYREILDVSHAGYVEWEFESGKVFCSQVTLDILRNEGEPGWLEEEKFLEVFPDGECEQIRNLKTLISGEQRRLDVFCHDKNGNKVFLELMVKVDKEGARLIASLTDTSERVKMERRLRHEALHDYLTGLPNRSLLVDRVQHILTRMKRDTDLNAALLFIDVDNFKAVNDKLGQGFGDDVLVSVGERLADIVRATDTVARFSGDEFVILLEEPTTAEIAEMLTIRLLEKLQKPLRVQNKSMNLTYSIGLVLIEDPEASAEVVLGDADIAMYRAKQQGKGQIVSFDVAMRKQAEKRLDIEVALREAMKNRELYLVYQPIFDIEQPEPAPVGVEALLRWTKSGGGNIAPGELLAVAEENGMIEDIGLWVIETATQQLRHWLDIGFPEDFYVNINLSSRHFEDEEIVEYMLQHIDRNRIPSSGIRIEVVESAVIKSPDKALNVIERLKDEGIRVSIDDFGTGFSSLSYLARFPFYALKIDRSFVMDVSENEASQNIVSAIILMAKKLNIRVVAEGIEEREQLDFLKSVGCELVQGYLLARPETTPEVDRFFVEGEMEVIGAS